jgi:Flp pilus assembly protein TadD
VTEADEPERTIERAKNAQLAGDAATARALLQGVLAAHPDHAGALHLLGVVEVNAGESGRAKPLLERALQLDANNAEAHYRLGVILSAEDNTSGALECFREAIRLRPGFTNAYVNIGAILQERGQVAEARACCERAVQLEPRHALALANLGAVLNEQGEFDAAERVLREAIAADPRLPTAHSNLLMALSAQARVREAWDEYEWRWQFQDSIGGEPQRRPFVQPVWDPGKTDGSLLVWCEQGVGDQLWTAGMIGDIESATAADVVLECNEKLVPLFRRSFPWADVVAARNPPAPICMTAKYQIGAGSLGRLFRSELAHFPQRAETGGGYLVADPAREEAWRKRVANLGPGLKVGICWRSNNMRGERALDCTELRQWGAILRVPDVRFVNLQYDECAAELHGAEQAFGVAIAQFPEVDMFNDLDETAALMRGLDLVIGAPTSVTVLSEALGVPTWRMIYGPDWQRFGQAQHPWYPTMRGFDRSWNQSWDEVLSTIAEALRDAASFKGDGQTTAKRETPKTI